VRTTLTNQSIHIMTIVDVDAEVEKAEHGALPPNRLHRESSLRNIYTDPFAAREGKTLTWRNVNMTLVSFCFVLSYSLFYSDGEGSISNTVKSLFS
jgi:hypothetical protein